MDADPDTPEDRGNSDKVRNWVIVMMADDYESFEIVLNGIRSLAGSRGIEITEGQVISGLERALAEGFAEAYRLSPTPPYSQKIQYSPGHLRELWYYATPIGKEIARKTSKQIPEFGGTEES
jgi:hypothetical protein